MHHDLVRLGRPRPASGRRTPAWAATAVLVALALGGCSGKSGGNVVDTAPGGDAPSGDLPAAQGIVASIESAGGLAGDQATSNLIFELHADGTVYSSSEDGGGFGFTSYRLNAEGLDRAEELLAQIVVDGTAYGEPSVSDMPSTTFSLRLDGGTGPAGEMSVYGLSDLPDDAGDLGLSGDEQAARQSLLDVLDGLTALAGESDLVDREPADYTPTDLDIAFLPVFADEGATPPEPLEWPLVTALADMQLGWEGIRPCTGIHGDDTAALIDAMGIETSGPQDAPWSTGASDLAAPHQVMVQVEVVLPQHPSCTTQVEPDTGPDSPPLLDGGLFHGIQLIDRWDWHGTFEPDDRRNAEPLEVFAALPAIAAGVTSDLGLSQAELTQYEYLAVVSTKNGKTFLELGAIDPDEQTPDEVDWAWQARVDLATGELVATDEI